MEPTDGEECVILNIGNEKEESLDCSVLLVEPSADFPEKEKDVGEVVDEECDLIVTFCKRAKMMAHARYDCTRNPFERAECVRSHPLGRNAETCDECYCYVCNKHAVECKDWVTPSLCHCNAHNKSKYWKDQCPFVLIRSLVAFNFKLSEVDRDIRCAGTLLQKFIQDISVVYNKYVSGERISSDCHKCLCQRNFGPGECDTCGLGHQSGIYSYSPVSSLVTEFLNKAEKQTPKTEVIMLLGAAREILSHKAPTSCIQKVDIFEMMTKPIIGLMERITRRLQRLLVLYDFPKPLYDKLIAFYQSSPFPQHFHQFSFSLNFVPWDHGSLTCILNGQSIGRRKRRGKKRESLYERVSVAEARTERLKNRQQYRELICYLRWLKCSDSQWLEQQRDKIPFYLCKTGDLMGAVLSFFACFSKSCCTACRLTLSQFEVFLKIFRTGQVPAGKEMEDTARWTFRGVPLQLPVLIEWTFRVLYSNMSLYKNPRCWSFVIKVFSSQCRLEPDGRLIPLNMGELVPDFQQMVFDESWHFVRKLAHGSHNDHFFSEFSSLNTHLEAGLIFVVQAVRQMILREYCSLTSFLDIVLAFRRNIWALKILLDSLANHEEVLHTIIGLIITDLHNRKAEMLDLWNYLGYWYVYKLLCTFLSSTDKEVFSVSVAIINIIKENLDKCLWAKQVGDLLQKGIKRFGWVCPELSIFIVASRALL